MSKGRNNNNRAGKAEFSGDTIIRFEDVSFEWGENKPILDEVSFTVRKGTKITLMGQNGAGKTTIFGLILGTEENRDSANFENAYKPESGEIHITNGATIAAARQVIPRHDLELTVRDFFAKCFKEKVYDLDPRIDEVLGVVNLNVSKSKKTLAADTDENDVSRFPLGGLRDTSLSSRGGGVVDFKDRLIKTFSGGQQARLLLASAIIQDPDILLLDEPTNNLDKAGIEHLTQFLVNYNKTCLVISHDAEFLNAFTHGVLYLDVHTKKVEQYVGDYKDVVEQISARIEAENRENARLGKEIQAKKEQANMFAMKGGQMRLVAKRMREKAEELSGEIVEVRKEDKTIKPFVIPAQMDVIGDIISISSYSVMSPKTHKLVNRTCDIKLRRRQHLLLAGPNGIGKSTLLESIITSAGQSSFPDLKTKGKPAEPKGRVTISDGVRIGYYRQDFSMMDFNDTVYQSLEKIIRATQGRLVETELRAVAASFLIGADAIHTRIGSLSEGQKGLVAFARLVLQRPGLLILDEPTNHINFRHLPVIAKALDAYEGAMILVSHVPEFVKQIRIDEVLELGKNS
jgi:ATPase subunit of ABC transporter with duplicated ATPase domains